jgi:hypothetical protein
MACLPVRGPFPCLSYDRNGRSERLRDETEAEEPSVRTPPSSCPDNRITGVGMGPALCPAIAERDPAQVQTINRKRVSINFRLTRISGYPRTSPSPSAGGSSSSGPSSSMRSTTRSSGARSSGAPVTAWGAGASATWYPRAPRVTSSSPCATSSERRSPPARPLGECLERAGGVRDETGVASTLPGPVRTALKRRPLHPYAGGNLRTSNAFL